MTRLVLAVAIGALWLGAALLTATALAPAAFAVLPTRALAGALVGRVLPVVFISGIAAGTAAGLLAGDGAGGRVRLVLGVVAALTCAAAIGVSRAIAALRDRIGPAGVDALEVTDPLRRQFGTLHGVSVLLLGVAMVALAAVVGWSALAAARAAR
jgi:hypothetical protein